MLNETCLIVLGCSDAFSSGGMGNTCFYIKTERKHLLVDCGATALYSMKKHGVLSSHIDAIILTHFHGDHFAGLPFILLDMLRAKRKKKLIIITPNGGKQKIAEALNLFYPGTSVLHRLDIEFHQFDGDQKLSVTDILVESFPVAHTKATLPHGLRITVEGKIIAYTGDTGWTDTIPDILRGADIAICECTFYKKSFKGHIDYKTLQLHLHEIKCKQLLLTHFDEEMLEHVNDIEVSCAYDGQVISLAAK